MAGRILIVDPVATNRMVLKAKLSLAHYDVCLADGVEQARAFAKLHRFEAVLLSSCLVDQSQNCALQWVREERDGRHDAVTFLIMQDRANRDCPIFLDQCLRAGVDDVLNRPFSEEVLLARIRNLMRDNAQTRELHETALEQGVHESGDAATDAPAKRVVATSVTPDDTPNFTARLRTWAQAVSTAGAHQIDTVPLSMLTQPDAAPNEPDIVMLVTPSGASEVALSIISQMRSRARMRDVRIILVLETPTSCLVARAFDLGAHDVVSMEAAPENTAARVKLQTQAHIALHRCKQVVRDGLRQAVLDPLTGLYNRRYAANKLQDMLQKCKKTGTSLSILAFDVDHFKGVNDRYGHAVGDIVLTTLADTLRKNLRDEDLISRTGGEEFLVALPNTDRQQAQASANRLREAVGNLSIEVEGQIAPLHVTVSVGLSVQNGRVSIPEMLEQADRALYQAKARGRNVVAISSAA